ncbi:glycosyl hydrolase [Streptacidiphilus sp. P02-A3a]|uniref:glycosyl hydrolase n=1 Tax=Streptacidiphilus sp. P02-A3a TaxID=2704468 RepID=UPI0015FA9E87|nr:glycosyl hydrolase [Streptacidiphilus sp. P02-A3a]QMU67311.1 glycosyl hydrolase [Streptacidiphilus sp. P02-A3a]
MNGEPDFRLDGLMPGDEESEFAESMMWPGDLTLVAEHHTTPNGSHSFFVVHDRSMTWGVPGSPQLVAVKIARDLDARTFTVESENHAALGFAQNWLIERGCPPGPITRLSSDFVQPADDQTIRVEQQIRNSGDRYKVLDTLTSDGYPYETWTMVRDSLASQDPIRVFLEEADLAADSYTVREGAFPDEDAALQWLDDRDTPLPEPPEYRGDPAVLRTRAALARSAGSTTSPGTGPSVEAPASVPARPTPGRSM